MAESESDPRDVPAGGRFMSIGENGYGGRKGQRK